jgi:GDP-mannose 6-dehydrogenase
MKISVFGLGYVGVVSSTCLAEMGHEVIGVDVNPTKVDLVKAGSPPIVETGLDELLGANVKAGRLRATTDAAEAVQDSELSMVAVGTPSDRSGTVSLDAVDAVVGQVGRAIRGKGKPHTLVIRSTVPPGSCAERIGPALSSHAGRPLGPDLLLCHNPEFLREGSSLKDFKNPPFTIIGAQEERGYQILEALYRGIDAPVVRTEWHVSESLKYLCNIYHAVKIGFANEIGAVLKQLGVDSRAAMDIFCRDSILNISSAYLRPGFAFGGSCLPKDLRAFMALAKQHEVTLPFLGNLLSSNDQHVERAFAMVTRQGRRKMALFGLAFKAGTDDVRESPMVTLAERLIGKGYELAIYDQHVDLARLIGANRQYIQQEIPHLERLLTADPRKALAAAEIVIVAQADADAIAAISSDYRDKWIIDLQGVPALAELPDVRYEGLCW